MADEASVSSNGVHASVVPTVGAGVLLANGGGGWEPGALLLPDPVLLLRFRAGACRLFAAGAEAPFLVRHGSPLDLLEEVMAAIRARVPVAGPRAGKPAFPLALVAAAYEFGRHFVPHGHCFPHASLLEDDEFFAAIFLDAYRPDRLGDVERFGYAGAVPAGWMPGAPALQTRGYGHTPPPVVPWGVNHRDTPAPLAPAVNEADFAVSVERIREYLAAGDIYQANLTIPFRGQTQAGAEDIFDVALDQGGAAYAGTMLMPGGTLLSFSPELLLHRRGDHVATRPIKGTRTIPPKATAAERDAIRAALLGSAKERAEHLMIVDLERSDLGRICETGTVEVLPFMEAREHPTVMHLESSVHGSLKPGLRLHDIFESIFPGGSVTGAPKRRALEIISEVEATPRGIYCGAFGWIDADGDMDLSLPIRSMILRPGGALEYHAGGGIVYDSTPAGEWHEVMAKTAFAAGVVDRAEEICRHDATDHH